MIKFGYQCHCAIAFEGLTPQNASCKWSVVCFSFLPLSIHSSGLKTHALGGRNPGRFRVAAILLQPPAGNPDMPCKFDATGRNKR